MFSFAKRLTQSIQICSQMNRDQRKSDGDVNQRTSRRMLRVNLSPSRRQVAQEMDEERLANKGTGRKRINVSINSMGPIVVVELVLKDCLLNLSRNTVITSSESHHLCPIKYGMMLFRDLLYLGLMFVPFLLFRRQRPKSARFTRPMRTSMTS